MIYGTDKTVVVVILWAGVIRSDGEEGEKSEFVVMIYIKYCKFINYRGPYRR